MESFFEPSGPVIRTSRHRGARNRLARLVQDGELVRLLPGIRVPREAAQHDKVRMLAALLWCPDGVLVGDTAARVLDLGDPGPVELATPRSLAVPPGFSVQRRKIAACWRCEVGELRISSPALTALDLAARDGGQAIDDMLRLRLLTVAQLETALSLFPNRPGNAKRAAVVARSRSEPWSMAERCFHKLLDKARITGWRANVPLRLGKKLVYPDVLFDTERLICEIDGYRYHTERFESDRERQNLLVAHGWRVLRFTWRMLENPEELLAELRAVLGRRGKRP